MESVEPFNDRINAFLAARAALPLPADMPAELVVISTGKVAGKWSYKHVYTAGDTFHFIFRKAELTDLNAAWQSADHELELRVKDYLTQTQYL